MPGDDHRTFYFVIDCIYLVVLVNNSTLYHTSVLDLGFRLVLSAMAADKHHKDKEVTARLDVWLPCYKACSTHGTWNPARLYPGVDVCTLFLAVLLMWCTANLVRLFADSMKSLIFHNYLPVEGV